MDNKLKKKNLDSNPILLGRGGETNTNHFLSGSTTAPSEAGVLWKLSPGRAAPAPTAKPPPTHSSKSLYLKNPS